MKCYRKNGSDAIRQLQTNAHSRPSMKCYRKNGSDCYAAFLPHMGELPQ